MKVDFLGSAEYVGTEAFKDCVSLTEISLPKGIEDVKNSVFYGCSNLTTVHIPEGVKTIEASAFYNCKKLSEVVIPEGVKKIDTRAFYECDFAEINIPSTLTELGANAFQYCDKLEKVNITDIGAWCNVKFYDATSNPLSNAALYLDGLKVEDLVISSGVTTIMDHAFSGYADLKSIRFSDDLTTIYSGAFSNCHNLKEVHFGRGISFVVTNAFLDCDSITSVHYAGSEAEWEDVLFGAGNESIISKDVKFGVFTKTLLSNSSDAEYVYTITATDAPVGCIIVFVCYDGNTVAHLDVKEYAGSALTVEVDKTIDFDSIKVLTWDNPQTMNQLCNAEFPAV